LHVSFESGMTPNVALWQCKQRGRQTWDLPITFSAVLRGNLTLPVC
jgi:hypothetical protein